MTNPWFEALGLEPAVLEGVFQVEDGLIQTITENPEVQSAEARQAWDAFRLWVLQNHNAMSGRCTRVAQPI